ncbi:MAG: hypothetical protein GY820_30225 [Gammaproteobacteria bacterium]|nr:hypothetical protein [Gammaproteobacteria bacterium]
MWFLQMSSDDSLEECAEELVDSQDLNAVVAEEMSELQYYYDGEWEDEEFDWYWDVLVELELNFGQLESDSLEERVKCLLSRVYIE